MAPQDVVGGGGRRCQPWLTGSITRRRGRRRIGNEGVLSHWHRHLLGWDVAVVAIRLAFPVVVEVIHSLGGFGVGEEEMGGVGYKRGLIRTHGRERPRQGVWTINNFFPDMRF